ncbi:hypothetical protein [Alterinioella nitratireducens]|uniref:hypothetical protein n=1 Tax=Alterinioella nitratireducens TaxID=2735915 RepID=UPI0015546686|nr:hypothetical protein [Alterinioella nitratireducens]NPD21395.1 hypothetical protein [Alterinioella nitratireducens]
MSLFRIAFLVISIGAIAGTGYVSYHGWGRASTDLDASIRLGSGGIGGIGNSRVK